MSTITKTNGNDNIIGTNSDDDIFALAGNDIINPLRGYDYVDGGEGNDLLIVNYSSNTYNDGDGSDGHIESYLYDNGDGSYYGSFSASTVDWYDNVDFDNIERFQITGTKFDDYIAVGTGNDTVNGGAGIDTLTDDFSNSTSNLVLNTTGSTIIAPTGSSYTSIEAFIVTTGSGNDTITLKGAYDDTIDTGAGNDSINAGLGYDSVDGGEGNDLLIVNYSSNTYNDGDGSDGHIESYLYDNGDGSYYGSFSASTVDWYDNVDFDNIERFQITGTKFDDYIEVGDGNDTVNGGAGIDTLVGAGGNDILTGGSGGDELTGGAGTDRFGYKTLTDSLLASFDVITDFNANPGNDLFLVATARAAVNNVGAVTALTAAGIAAKLTTTNFKANYASQFSFGSRTFVAINNATAGFSATTDSIVEITDLTGNLALGNFVIA